MFFKHLYEKTLAQASYFIGCQVTREAIVIDPRRDIDVYLKTAEAERFKIKYITETHIHADFLSGSRELAQATGAEILLSDEGGNDWQYEFTHTGLKDSDEITIGNLRLKVLHTPGHTPEHISFLLTDLPSSKSPVMIFTGDFVFVGDVGRPDLLEKAAGIKGTQREAARQMFLSLKKFKQLPDYLQVWPAHGAGSACGKALGAVPSSTVGYEKISNWALNYNNEEGFIERLLDGQPEPPKYFGTMKRMNKEGAKILNSLPKAEHLNKNKFIKLYNDGVTIIDTRHKDKFSEKHISNTIHIQDNSSFPTWAGWILNYSEPFVLISDKNHIEHLTRCLIRVGLDNITGYFSETDELTNKEVPFASLPKLSVNELNDNPDNYNILDVRGYSEYRDEHIPNSKNIHAGTLVDNLDKIPANKSIVVQCESGDRSAIAGSLLLKNGYKNVFNLYEGINGWKSMGFLIEKEPVASLDFVSNNR
jgi:hydroxyacylglutathione hydrolase